MKKKFLSVLLCLIISVGVFGCSSKNTQSGNDSKGTSVALTENKVFDVVVDAESVFENNKVKFKITSNLPDGMELMLKLSNTDNGYIAQDKVSLKSGYAESNIFSNNGSSLKRGSYKLEITSPIYNVQPENVKRFIGKDGSNLKGKFIVSDSTNGNTVFFEKVVGMFEEESISSSGENERVNDLLFEAIKAKDTSSIKKYIDEGANINYINKLSKITPLMMACILGDEQLINSLIDCGADVNTKTDNGCTALFYCGQRDRLVKLLVSKGADINATDNKGQTYKASAKLSD